MAAPVLPVVAEQAPNSRYTTVGLRSVKLRCHQ
jgi:hypothetical protein